jgi:hypothetical protein
MFYTLLKQFFFFSLQSSTFIRNQLLILWSSNWGWTAVSFAAGKDFKSI